MICDKKVWCVGGRVNEDNIAMFKQNNKIIGGYFTWYGKTLKNFDTDLNGQCEWAPGGNFAVLRSKFLKVNGFDTNYIGFVFPNSKMTEIAMVFLSPTRT